jgi:hypothetical protein
MHRLYIQSIKALWFGGLVMLIGCSPYKPEPIPNATTQLIELHCQYSYLSGNSVCCLAPKTDRGRKLVVLGSLIDNTTQQPLNNQHFYLYQPNSCGKYTNNLHTLAETDSLGRFIIETILPAEYLANNEDQFIKIIVPGAEQDSYTLYFKPFAKARKGTMVELFYLERGVLVGEAKVTVH